MALCSSSARALAQTGEGDSELVWSVGAGCALVLGSMAVGGAISGVGETDRSRRTGIDVMSLGLALAPALSHGLAGEWKRAALFGGSGLAIAAFDIALVEHSTAVLDHGPPSSRIPFGVALTTQVMVSAAGLVDSLMARERRQGARLALLPLIDRRAVGAALAGVL
jgi:hypothetical protein